MPAAEAARRAQPAELAALLAQARAQTLWLFDRHAEALPGWRVPQSPELNPPLWEFGHVAWFAEWWTVRNTQRGRGAACPPDAPRGPSLIAHADALYDSSAVPHDVRWSLPLPDAAATRAYLRDALDATLAALDGAADDDAALYFHRLALFHEDMHAEAFVYMGQQLGIDALAVPLPEVPPRRPIEVAAAAAALGRSGPGFAFDNELPAHRVALAAFEIDSAPVRCADFIAFIDDGGYDEPRWWSAAGWQWRLRHSDGRPRFWRRDGGAWQRTWFGRRVALPADSAAMPLSAHEAEAWCAWAGRRLPSEAEWEHAALTAAGFQWGGVWEWTRSTFCGYPGFTPHPYKDYSQPWFGTHRVLRGGSVATAARMKHAGYRNFFLPSRNDIFAGLRSCAP